MIDEQWLQSLNFASIGGGRIEGLAGAGSESIHLLMSSPSRPNERFVIEVRRVHLGFAIREVPPILCEKPLYSVKTLNSKLGHLIGSRDLDEICLHYDILYCAVIKLLFRGGLDLETLIVEYPHPDHLKLFLGSPGFTRRLSDFASQARRVKRTEDDIVMDLHVHSPFQIRNVFRDSLAKWAMTLQKKIEKFCTKEFASKAATLHKNPYYVWGAAVMDGFFQDHEMLEAIDFIRSIDRTTTEDDQWATYFLQMNAFCGLYAYFVPDTEYSWFVSGAKLNEESALTRLVRFLALAGFVCQPRDVDGRVVADGMKEMLAHRGK